MKENIPCKSCGKERLIDTSKFSIKRYLKRSPNCRKCATKKPTLRLKISKGWFKKGSAGFVGPHSEETKRLLSIVAKKQRRSIGTEFKIGQNTGDKNTNWRGDNVSYHGMHSWVRRMLGRPLVCASCGTKNKKIEWANKSHQYKRVLSDWISLCKPCHGKHDSGKNYGAAKRRFNKCASS